MTPHESFEAYWAGERPERIPFSIYGAFCGSLEEKPAWAPLFERGLVPTYWMPTFSSTRNGVEKVSESYEENGQTVRRTTLKTPVGEIYATSYLPPGSLMAWPKKHWLSTAEDYRVRTWLVKNLEIRPNYGAYHRLVEQTAPWGLVLPAIGRTPFQRILVDWAGLEQFTFHLIELEEEVLELYEALFENFRKIVEITAEGPGRYVACQENFTAESMGPVRYERFLLPVYKECIPTLHQAGKVVGTHYDGNLSSVKHHIADAPIDLIESLTEPPEGDMTLAESRAAWPEKRFWNNINVAKFDLPPDQLQAEIHRGVAEAAPDGRGLAFEISEDLPKNWRQGIPAVLEALGY